MVWGPSVPAGANPYPQKLRTNNTRASGVPTEKVFWWRAAPDAPFAAGAVRRAGAAGATPTAPRTLDAKESEAIASRQALRAALGLSFSAGSFTVPRTVYYAWVCPTPPRSLCQFQGL